MKKVNEKQEQIEHSDLYIFVSYATRAAIGADTAIASSPAAVARLKNPPPPAATHAITP